MYKNVLIPTDGTPLSLEAIKHGVELAKEIGAKIALLTITEPFHVVSFEVDQLEDTPDTYDRHTNERASRVLGEAERIVGAAGVPYTKIHVQDDQPYRGIVRTAEENGCDLIVMASHGRRGISALVLGSETTKVLTHSTIPVLVCRLSPQASVVAGVQPASAEMVSA